MYHNFSAGLEIYFEDSEYSVGEDEAMGAPIHMKFRKTQNPFILTLSPASINDAETVFNVGNFIDFDTIVEPFRATPGMDYQLDSFRIVLHNELPLVSC